MAASALSDLFARASIRVAKNSARGVAECSIFSDETGSECE